MHLWESKSHAVYSIPLCFYIGWKAYLKTMSKIHVWPYYLWVLVYDEWDGFLHIGGTWVAVARYRMICLVLGSGSSDHISF